MIQLAGSVAIQLVTPPKMLAQTHFLNKGIDCAMLKRNNKDSS
jgi:hypothetical protein